MSFSASTISPSDFAATLSRYSDTINAASKPKPEPLTTLDDWRRNTLPSIISSRGSPHMLKDEVYRLVDCKLKRGKMRPILRLIEANPEGLVISITTAAFAVSDIKTSFSTLLALKGVGPATASYLLAAHRFPDVPVFSDEAFRWVVHGGDWGAKIKYDVGEYWEFFEKMQEIARRLEVTPDDVERVGFVLGQEAAAAAKTTGRKKGKEEVELKEKKPIESKKRKVTADTENSKAKKLRAKKTEEKAASGRALRSRKPPPGTQN